MLFIGLDYFSKMKEKENDKSWRPVNCYLYSEDVNDIMEKFKSTCIQIL